MSICVSRLVMFFKIFLICAFLAKTGFSLRIPRAISSCVDDNCITNRTCEPLSLPSLSINCQDSKRRGVSCQQRASPGTRANLFCKEGYQLTEDPGFYSVTCEDDGIWDKCPFSCQPVCGVVDPLNDESDVGRYPWYATIFYSKNENDSVIVCGGTIISENVILTAAYCIYDQSAEVIRDSSDIKVAVGTGINNWNDISAPYAQYYDSKQLIVFPLFKGFSKKYRDDIGAIILKDRIKFNSFIGPACVDIQNTNSGTEPPKGTTYTLVGYKNLMFGKLESVEIPSLTILECIDKISDKFKEYITVNKLCIENPETNSKDIRLHGFGGSGVMDPISNKETKVLKAILSISLISQGIMLMTDISHYRQWIKNILEIANEKDKPLFCGRTFSSNNDEDLMCTVPPLPENGEYLIGGIGGVPKAGTMVPEWSVIRYRCDSGYGIIGEDTGVCNKGQWSTTPICLKTCKGLTSSSVQLDCIYNNKSVPCDQPAKPGTKAYLSCKRGYRLPYTPDFNSVTCETDGTWDYSIYRCAAECGIARPKGTSLVIKGQDATFQDFPWHIGIYRKNLNGQDKHGIWCGGSILTNKLVITAAHCFYEPGTVNQMNKLDFLVAAGKIHEEWNNTHNSNAQYSEIDQLIVPNTYYDIQGNYAQDIALLKLRSVLEFSAIVRPICLDWDFVGAEEEFVVGTKGLVAGWGLTSENGNISSTLKYAVLPTVSRQSCLEQSPYDFRPFITADKFCAGYLNGTSVCRGDSGGGLAMPIYSNGDEPVYYLRGIVSVGAIKDGTCDSHKYTAFTRVLTHINWLKQYRGIK